MAAATALWERVLTLFHDSVVPAEPLTTASSSANADGIPLARGEGPLTPWSRFVALVGDDEPHAVMWLLAICLASVAVLAVFRRCCSCSCARLRQTRTLQTPLVAASPASDTTVEEQDASDPVAADAGAWPAKPPRCFGQLPRQCACFLRGNYYVGRVGQRVLDVHLPYDGDTQALLRRCCTMKLSAAESHEVQKICEDERSRRLAGDREAEQRKQQLATAYLPLDVDVRRLSPQHLDPELLRLVALATQARTDPAAENELWRSIRTVGPGIFDVPVFNIDFCQRLVTELTHVRESVDSALLARPNSMNKHGKQQQCFRQKN